MLKGQQYFIGSMSRRLPYFWYMLKNLPTIVFWGVRVKTISLDVCHTTLPFNGRTKNPFRSIYFAALCGGAELASGLLCMLHLSGEKRFSMLVVDFNAQFIKKANKEVTMKCEDGEIIKQKLSDLSKPGDTAVVVSTVTAHHPDNEVVAKFEITWSFKRK